MFTSKKKTAILAVTAAAVLAVGAVLTGVAVAPADQQLPALAPGDVWTYDAWPCGIASSPIQVYQSSGDSVPLTNIAVAQVGAFTWLCVTIDRSEVNITPSEDAYAAIDSGYPLAECTKCQSDWE